MSHRLLSVSHLSVLVTSLMLMIGCKSAHDLTDTLTYQQWIEEWFHRAHGRYQFATAASDTLACLFQLGDLDEVADDEQYTRYRFANDISLAIQAEGNQRVYIMADKEWNLTRVELHKSGDIYRWNGRLENIDYVCHIATTDVPRLTDKLCTSIIQLLDTQLIVPPSNPKTIDTSVSTSTRPTKKI